MKNSLVAVVVLTLTLALSACTGGRSLPGGAGSNGAVGTGGAGAPTGVPDSAGPKKPQGIEVGNGLTASFTSDYKLKISYHPDLDFHQVAESEFYVDNLGALMPGEQRSVIRFKVYRDGKVEGLRVNTLPQLERYLRSHYPYLPYQATDVNGLHGFVVQNSDEKQLHAVYYLRSPSSDVIFATIDAYAAGSGLTRIPPIITTLRLDQTPPVLDKLEVLSTNMKPGQRLRLRFHATDDLSGVLPELWLRVRGLTANDLKPTHAAAQRLGDNWFLIEMVVPTLSRPGNYLVESLAIADRAGNRRVLRADLKTRAQNIYGPSPGNPPIQLIRFHVLAPDEQDATAPTVKWFKFEEPVVPAGTEGAVVFEAKDDGSGLEIFRPTWGELAPCFESKESQTIGLHGQAVEMPDGHFRLTFNIGPYALPGRYYLRSFGVTDHALNLIRVSQNNREDGCAEDATYPNSPNGDWPIPAFEVLNESPSDAVSPELKKVKLRSDQITAGDPILVLFQATDDYSGIAHNFANGGVFECGQGMLGRTFLPIFGPVRPLDDDWYEIEVDTESDLQSVDCWLKELVIEDAAGNRRMARARQVSDDVYEGLTQPTAPLRVHIETGSNTWDWHLFDLP